MNKIAVITITCRENGRLPEVSRTLAASVMRTDPDTSVLWIIVDEKGRSVGELADANSEVVAGMRSANRLDIAVIPPLPSSCRQGPDKTPAHNSARSAGLIYALETGVDYIVFLNDCNLVTQGFVSVARDVCLQGVGWRCRMQELPDMKLSDDGVVKWKDHHDLLRPVPYMSVASAAWGAPAARFADIHGFDLAYDGERKNNDVDAIVRLHRAGVQFVSTERAYTVQLRRTKNAAEITTKKEVFLGVRNKRLFNALIRDKSRILPTIEAPWKQVASALGFPSAPPGPDLEAAPGDARGQDDAKAQPAGAPAPAVIYGDDETSDVDDPKRNQAEEDLASELDNPPEMAALEDEGDPLDEAYE